MPLDQYPVFMSPKIKQYTCIILLYELSRINVLISSYQEAGTPMLMKEKYIGKRNIKVLFEQSRLQAGIFFNNLLPN